MRQLTIGALLALGLAGCGGGAAGTSAAPAPATTAPVARTVPVPAATAGNGGSSTQSTLVSTSQATPAPNVAAPAPLAPTASGTYADANGTFPYVLYVSSHAHAPFPLVLALHGCLENPTNFEAGTRWFEDAETFGYAVVMPAHGATPGLNPNGCFQYWNQHYRGRGEAAALAGLVKTIQTMDGADPHHTYVAGMSSGAAQAVALAADYPDVFAAVGVHSGIEYQPCVTDDVYQCYVALATPAANQPPQQSGRAAYAQDPAWNRAVPALFIHGDADTVVPPFNLQNALTSFATMNDGFTSGGTFPGALTATPQQHTSGAVPGGYTYDSYAAANGTVDWIVVHGMNHAWSGGVAYPGSNGTDGNNYNDPKGPNATALFRTFFFGCSI